MPSYRSPKGSLVRTLPDWNARTLSQASVEEFAQAGSGAQNYYLFNNSLGALLVVWDITATIFSLHNPADCVVSIGRMRGKAGILQHTSQYDPVYGDQPLNYGQIWSDALLAGSASHSYIVLVAPGTWSWPHDYPFCVLTAGQSLAVQFDGNNIVGSASFTYEQIDQT